ncbi:hypothetical protein F4818DRAFT_43338 [Hypoxylon cercidicola]|nr:hypothetical protein F4818DRAFT_43338 [Hypoxylon cercidicola]
MMSKLALLPSFCLTQLPAFILSSGIVSCWLFPNSTLHIRCCPNVPSGTYGDIVGLGWPWLGGLRGTVPGCYPPTASTWNCTSNVGKRLPVTPPESTWYYSLCVPNRLPSNSHNPYNPYNLGETFFSISS